MANPSAPQQPVTSRGPRLHRNPPADPLDTPESGAAAELRRDQIKTAAGLGVIAGIWLIISPFVLGYGDGDPYWNDIVFGAVIVVLSGVRFAMTRGTEWAGWLMALAGAWIFASAFWLDSTSTAEWNDIVLGIIVFIIGLAAATTIRRRS